MFTDLKSYENPRHNLTFPIFIEHKLKNKWKVKKYLTGLEILYTILYKQGSIISQLSNKALRVNK